MISMLKHGGRTAVLALALIALACESGTEPAGTSILNVEDASAGLLGETSSTVGSELSFAHRAIAQASDEVLRKKIGVEGGELTLLGHTLTVPAGALDRPTMFIMAVLAGSEIQVELIAYDPDLYTDVGGKGFNVPVQLALSYAGVDGDPDNLVIVHVKTDGTRVPLATTLDEAAGVVRASLDHFSRYGLCGN